MTTPKRPEDPTNDGADAHCGAEADLEEKNEPVETAPADTPAPPPPHPSDPRVITEPLSHLSGMVWTVVGIVVLVAGALGFWIGTYVSKTPPELPPPEPTQVVDGAQLQTPADLEDIVRDHNVVWRVFNGDGESLPDTPVRGVAASLLLILSPSATEDGRNAGLTTYLNKCVFYFSNEERQKTTEKLFSGSPQETALAFMLIAKRDLHAAKLIDDVLKDHDRMEKFLAGEKVPLEKLPDGTEP